MPSTNTTNNSTTKKPSPSFNKLLIRNMRRRYPIQLATVSDEDIVKRHNYITQELNTNLTRDPQHLKYMTGYKKLPDEYVDMEDNKSGSKSKKPTAKAKANDK